MTSSEPDEPSTSARLPSPPPSTARLEDNTSTQSLLSRGGSGYESQFGSSFGSLFSITDGAGVYVSALALTIIISALVVVGIILVAIVITLAVMLSSCENQKNVTLGSLHSRANNYCSSFLLNMEMHNLQGLSIPSECLRHVYQYVHGGQYLKDVEVAVDSARMYAKSLVLDHSENYTAVLDIDETALSNFLNDHSSLENMAGSILEISIMKSKPVPIIPLLTFYNELRAANWSIVFLSERPVSAWNRTVESLVSAGYESWSNLILRPRDESVLTIQEYKSKKMAELGMQGYCVKIVVGDQWSDVTGSSTPGRSFKLPNPVYQLQ